MAGNKDFLKPGIKKEKPSGANALSFILSSPADLPKENEDLNKDVSEEIPQVVPSPESTTTTDEPKPIVRGEKKPRAKAPALKPVEDRRRAEDKKVVFTNSIRGSILTEIHKIIPEYKRKVDIDYNLARFLEDAAIARLETMRKLI